MRAQSALSLLLAAGALAGEVVVNRDGHVVKREANDAYDCSPDDVTCCAYYDICDYDYIDDYYYSELAYYESIYYEELSSLYNDGYFTDEIPLPTFNPTEFDNPTAIASEESALESIFANPTVSDALKSAGAEPTAFTPLITPAPTPHGAGSQPSAAASGGAPASTPASGGSQPQGGNPLSGGGSGAAADLRIPTMASLLLGGALVAVVLL